MPPKFKLKNVSAQPEVSDQSTGLTLRMLRLYRLCDGATEKLIYVVIVFGPWAFGTTQPWSIWTMNAMGYLLGALLAVKLAIRLRAGYENPRSVGNNQSTRLLRRLLAVLTLLILGYGLLSVLNSYSTYLRDQVMFDFHPHVEWLPNSHDRTSSWLAFCNYLAMACWFWAAGDWLMGKTPTEQRAQRTGPDRMLVPRRPLLPERLRRLVWVLTISGGLLGLEGIIQRLSGIPRLLFLVRPRVDTETINQFASYAYRANGAQFFNLLWPVSLAFWWTLYRSVDTGSKTRNRAARLRYLWLLICVLIMAACPILSTSRTGAMVAMVSLVAAVIILGSDRAAHNRVTGLGVIAVLAVPLTIGLGFGWESLGPRLSSGELREGFAGRNFMYQQAEQMAVDYPVFGTGPGTFEVCFQLYRIDPDEYWPAQLHNDWLETRITFGLAGCLLIGLSMCAVLGRWFVPGGIPLGGRALMLIWLAVAGCLFHARYDFPFQVYSIVSLFLTICAILFALSHSRAR